MDQLPACERALVRGVLKTALLGDVESPRGKVVAESASVQGAASKRLSGEKTTTSGALRRRRPSQSAIEFSKLHTRFQQQLHAENNFGPPEQGYTAIEGDPGRRFPHSASVSASILDPTLAQPAGSTEVAAAETAAGASVAPVGSVGSVGAIAIGQQAQGEGAHGLLQSSLGMVIGDSGSKQNGRDAKHTPSYARLKPGPVNQIKIHPMG